ncbi:MAG: HEAT repeat domain-containing protein, partial [Phycisphaerae bacterium]|nr:HEAT repeat domain-containing protein [Phycisphaerae bacterium]
LLRALADDERANLHASIVGVLSEMGKSAVDPLVVALASEDNVLKGHIIWVLGELSYRQAGPYLREIVEDEASRPEIRQAAQEALNKLRGLNAPAGVSAAELYYRLANDYYYGKITQIAQSGVETAKVWYFKADIGPTFALVPGKVYDEIMTMRSCQRALELDEGLSSAVCLWLSGALQMEAKLGAGEKVSLLGENWPGAQWFVVTAGQRYLQEVLARAEKDGNAPVALGAVQGLDLTAGRGWLSEGSRVIPLADALRFPDKRVRIAAAFALARAFPQEKFMGAEGVVPTLCEAVRQTGRARAVIMDVSADVANKLQGEMRELGYDTQVATSLDDALELARVLRGPDLLVIGVDSDGGQLAELVGKLQQDFALASTAVVFLANEATMAPASELAVQNPYMQVLDAGVSGRAVAASHKEILIGVNQSPISKAEADEFALAGAELLVQIATRDRRVYDINVASDTLIGALHDPRTELVKLALQGLSLLRLSDNQQAVADYALDEQMPMELRLIALDRLGESARLWGNQLRQEQIARLMKEVLEGAPSEFHSKTARVVGTLSLPSEIIKELILRKEH